MISFNFWKSASALLIMAGACAQAPQVLSVTDPPKAVVKRDAGGTHKLSLKIQDGYHTNSNTPSEAYLIPLKLTWGEGPLEAVNVAYPKPKFEKFEFSEKPLSIFDGTFEIVTQFKAKPGAAVGPGWQSGKLRYQACNNKMCLAPRTIDVKAPVSVE